MVDLLEWSANRIQLGRSSNYIVHPTTLVNNIEQGCPIALRTRLVLDSATNQYASVPTVAAARTIVSADLISQAITKANALTFSNYETKKVI
jgi:hypothetical protein